MLVEKQSVSIRPLLTDDDAPSSDLGQLLLLDPVRGLEQLQWSPNDDERLGFAQ